MKNNKNIKIIKREEVFKGKFLRVIRKYILANKNEYIWECVEKGPGSFIFPMTKEKEVILEKIYRYPSESFVISLPAGMVDKKENSKDCAKRELLEEAGYRAKKMIYIYDFPISPGLSSQMGTLFFAPDVEYVGEEALEDLEIIEILKVPLKNLPKFLFNPPKGVSVDIRIFSALAMLKEKKLI
jgi:8-oxo-dGTP pyrophosphatase MutT (NUDIX family)